MRDHHTCLNVCVHSGGAGEGAAATPAPAAAAPASGPEPMDEDALLQQALAMSMEVRRPPHAKSSAFREQSPERALGIHQSAALLCVLAVSKATRACLPGMRDHIRHLAI